MCKKHTGREAAGSLFMVCFFIFYMNNKSHVEIILWGNKLSYICIIYGILMDRYVNKYC